MNVSFSWNASVDSLSGVMGYEIVISTDNNFSVIYSSDFVSGLNKSISLSEGLYYWKVRAKDNALNFSDFSSVFTILVDTTLPEIIDNQEGDDVERSSNVATYNVSFEDYGSLLYKFQIKATTAPNGGGELVFDWSDVAVNINSTTYSGGWQITNTQFDLLKPGTNYISIRVYDNAQNVSISTDVFYIVKSAGIPTIIDNQTGDDIWISSNSRQYDVDFEDNSAIEKFEVKTSSYNAQWYLVLDKIGRSSYTLDWSLPEDFWELLPGGTNYISVRVWDKDNNYSIQDNVFYVLKDTIPPQGMPTSPTYINNYTFNLYYSTSDDTSGVDYVELYYTYETVAPFNWIKYGSTFSLNPIVFTSTQSGYVGFKIIAYDKAQNQEEGLPDSTTTYEFQTIIDLTNPLIVKNQTGDDVWRNSGETLYDVDFKSAGLSPLYKAQYKAVDGNGNTVIDWSDIANVYGMSEYKTNWGVDFNLLRSSYNYISVRTSNLAGTTTTLSNAFYIKKDTDLPQIADSQSGDNLWRGMNDGYYDVDFTDNFSGIYKFQVKSTTGPNQSGVVTSDWTDVISNINSFSYTLNWQLPQQVFDNMASGINYVSVKVYDIAGNISVSTDVFYVLKDTQPALINDNQDGDDVWRSTASGLYKVYFEDLGQSGLNKFQIKLTTGPNQSGLVISDWVDVITNINDQTYNIDWEIPASIFNLMQNGTNYVTARVSDNANHLRLPTDVFYVLKDNLSPVVTNNHSGDNFWHSMNDGYYDVDFTDNISGIYKFQVRSSTGPNQSGVVTSDWTDVISNINSFSYTLNWQLPQEVFDNMFDGINYVSVRLYDVAGNISVSTDVFYVLKDTQPALINDNQDGDDIWRSTGSGLYSVYFEDLGQSGLNKFQIKVTTGQGQSGLVISDWVDVITNINEQTYNIDWEIPASIFNLMQNGTNYVSVRVYDNANNVRVSTDVFYVLKDTVPPYSISDLNASTGNEGEINITFTSPSDTDDTAVSSYIVKYATFNITSDNFDLAQTYQQSWQPAPGNNLESKTITELLANTLYYIAIKSIDKAGNVSNISNVVSAISGSDVTPPAAISDLNAYPGSDIAPGSIVVEFTATGDNQSIGSASGYKLRWRNDGAITDENLWQSATEYIQSWQPKASGEKESFVLYGFEVGTTYYFNIRAYDEANNISGLSNSTYTYGATSPPRDGIIVYQSGTGNVAIYRRYSPPNFGLDYSLPVSDAGATSIVRHVIVRSSPFRNEMIAGILSSDGVLQIMRYNGATNQWTKEWSTTTITATNSAYRGFDIAYEQISGRAMVLYNGVIAGTLYYNIYDGENWSGAVTLSTGSAYAVAWVRLEPGPNSNEFMAVFSKLTSLELYAIKWNGTNWQDGYQLRNGVGVTTMQDFDLAWTNDGSKCLVVFGAGNIGYAQTRIYSGIWATGPNFSLQGANGTIRYIVAKSDPNSKYIGVASFDTGADWNANIYDSDSNIFISQATENPLIRAIANQNRPIDAIWDNSSKFIIAAAHNSSYGVLWASWTVNNGWAISLANAPVFTGWSNRINGVKLENDKDLNSVYLCANSVTSNDLRCARFTGADWEFISPNPLTTNLTANTYQPYYFATTRHDVISPTITDYQTGDDIWRSSNTAYYDIDATDAGGSGLRFIQTKIYTGPGKTGSLIEDWTAQASTSGVNFYYDNWRLTDETFNKLKEGINYVSVRAVDGAFNYSNEIVDAFYIKKDTTPPTAPLLNAPADGLRLNLLSVNFSWNSSSDYSSGVKDYEIIISTFNDFSQVLFSSSAPNTSIVIDLPYEGEYFWKVRARDNALNYSNYSSTWSILVDTTVPQIINNQTGDDIWISSNSRSYDVDFNDSGGSLLNKFQIKATTGPSETGTVIFNWSDVLVDINLSSYTDNWIVPQNLWNLLPNGTSYISVRVYDNAGNFSTSAGFYIRKDIISPQIINNQIGDNIWRNTNNAYYDVDFQDSGGSLIEKIQIKSSTGANFTGILNFDWIDFIIAVDSASYTQDFQLPPALWNNLKTGKNYMSFKVFDYAGNVTVSTDTFYILKDSTPPSTPILYSPDNNSNSLSSTINFNWYPSVDDASGIKEYLLYISTDEGFSVIYSSITAISTSVVVTLLPQRYFWKVVALDNALNYSQYSSTFSLFIDTVPPQIVNNQTGDDIWRNANNAYYDVDFIDSGGSLLSKFQIKATTGPDETGMVIFNWSDVVTNINFSSYSDNWTIPQDLWNLLPDGTSYISVKVYDNAGNFSNINAFYIKKDVTFPTIYDNQSGDDVWRAENTGFYNVDFYDATSFLNRFDVKITTGLNQTGTVIVDWTPLVTNINSNLYTEDWKITDSMFNLLPVGVNYVSVRVYDNAQNVSISTDVFYIRKDTMPVSIINNETFSHYGIWLNTNSLVYDIDAYSSGVSSLDRIEIAISTTGYGIEPYFISWTTAVLNINATYYTMDWGISDEIFGQLQSGLTNYVSVRVYNQANNKTTLSDAFLIFKDTVSSIYQNNISNEYIWHNSSSTLYDVDIIDLGGSGVLSFEVMASTSINGQNPLTSWVVAVSTPINKLSYTDNWALPQTVWTSLIEEVTNYISIKIYDVAYNTSTYYDVFKVFKDTTPPTITDNEPGDYYWRNDESGFYNVGFEDSGGSGLNKFQLRVSTNESSTSYYIDWMDNTLNLNTTYYNTPWQINSQIWSLIPEGTGYIDVRVFDNAGNFRVSPSHVFIVKKDTTAPSIPILISPLSESSTNSLTVNFSWGDSTDLLSGTTVYEIVVSTYESFDFIYYSTITVSTQLNISLPHEDKYFWKVRAKDIAGNWSTYSSSYSVIIDTTSPEIINNQPQNNLWISSNTGYYDIDFNDSGGSLLDKFQIKITTGPSFSGILITDWVDISTNINASSYTDNWQIPPNIWDLMQTGTNYVSVRVYDKAQNLELSTDTFYVLKDTITPAISINQSYDLWYSSDPGNIFNPEFSDYHSRLSSAAYYVYSQENKGGVFITSSTIFGPNLDSYSYTDSWSILFDNLKEGYNWVSIKAWDIAQNTTEYIDAFYVKKDTTSPLIEDLQEGDTNFYKANPGNIFNVNFYDYGVGISSVSLKITTGPYESGSVLVDGATIYYFETPQNSVAGKWGISDEIWNLLISSTNYVSIYAYDGLNQMSFKKDAFYIQKDTIVPAAITNLNAYNNLVPQDEGTIYLSWTASGDDGNVGVAKSYLIRYATYPINESNFESALVYNSTLTPKSAGEIELIKLDGLEPGNTYYAAIKVVDKANNISNVSNTTSTYATPDLTPPQAISDLNAIVGDFTGQIKLIWTAPGEGTKDNPGNNPVSGYVVKYATYPIDSSNFDSAQTYNQNWAPEQPQSLEERIMEGLEPETTYYIAIKSYDEVNNISQISNTTSTYAAPRGARDGILLYSKGGSATLKYKKYTPPNWSQEFDTGISFSGTVRWVVLKSLPVIRNIKIAAVIDSNNVLKVLKYDGVSDTWSDITPSPAPTPGSSVYRNFDLAVEQNNARVVFVYYNGTLGNVSYAVWSATQNAWGIAPSNLAMASLTGTINWLRLKEAPNSDKIALAVLDSNSDISASIWNGTSWIDNINLTLSGSIATQEAFDISWESQSGDLLALWGTGTTTNYRKWYSTSTWGATLQGPNVGNTVRWVRLCSSPLSDKIGLSVIYGATAWNVAIWRPSGTEGWSALPAADTAMSANDKRVTDCAWQSKTEKFVAVSVDNLGTYDNQFDWIVWQNGNWNPASPSVTIANSNTNFGSSNIKWVKLISDPDTDNIKFLGVDSINNLRTTVWSGSVWAGAGSSNNAYHGSVGDFNYEPFAFDFSRHDNIPPTIVDNQSGDDLWRNSNYATYSVFANDTGGSLLKDIQTKIFFQANLIEDWTTQVLSINATSYTQPWKLTDFTFNKLPQGQSNVYVRTVDNAGNYSNGIEAFYIRKDTTPPAIINNMPSGFSSTWTATGVGLINIDFTDRGGSGLSSATYSVWTSTNLSGINVVSDVLISSNINSNLYTDDWNIDFSLLANGTNYITVTVWDNANSSTTLVDAFKVLKDTIAPAQITDLVGSLGPTLGTVLLNFTSPGDDGSNGDNFQGGYIIKYATFAIINDVLFDMATTYNEAIIPKPQGETESIIIYSLDENTTYYFAVKTYDKANNLSLISNSASSMPQRSNIFINEVYPSGGSGEDWVELYNNTLQDFSLEGWKLVYKQGPVDSQAAEVDIWTGVSTDTILSGGFKLININLDLNSAQSYSLLLKNSAGKVVDKLQWPVLSAGQSFSRIYDGSKYFEVDLTPTGGYNNSLSSSTIKINEISFDSSWKFIELYNTTNTVVELNNYLLRNSNNTPFRFSRRVSSYSYTLVDDSSISLDGYNWIDAFGITGLKTDGDFLVLENEAGQTVDRVNWKQSLATLYLYNSSLALNAPYAPSANVSLVRFRGEGSDTNDDSYDFSQSSLMTPLSRNVAPSANSNLLIYPYQNAYLPPNFTIKLKLGEDFSQGYANMISFIRTGGNPDENSPHIFILNDIGFNLSNLSTQTVSFSYDSLVDIDGKKLNDGSIYKVLLVSDNSSASAPSVIVTSVTVNNIRNHINGYESGNKWLDENKYIDVFKLDVYNESKYEIKISTIVLKFQTTDYINLDTQQLRSILKEITIFKDSNYGNKGMYEYDIDNEDLVSVYNNNFNLSDGLLYISVSSTNFSAAIPSNSSATYFIVMVASDNASNATLNAFISSIELSSSTFIDKDNMISQPVILNYSSVESSFTVILATAIEGWSFDTGVISNINTTINYWSNVYIGATDGVLRTLDYYNGQLKWSFTTNPNSPIITSPLVSLSTGYVDTYLYFGCANGDIYKLKDNDTTYSLVWKTNISGVITSEIFDSDTKLYFGVNNNRIYCLNKADGNICDGWNFDSSIDSPITSPMAIDYRPDVNLGWVGLENGRMIAFRLNDGVVVNQFVSGGAIYSSPFVDSAYAQATNNIYVGSTDGKLYSRIAANLNVTPPYWSDLNTLSPIYSSPFKVPYSDYIIIGNNAGKLYKVSASSGVVLAEFNSNYPIKAMPVEFNGVVYFAAGKYVYAIDLASFQLKEGWPIYIGSEIKANFVLDAWEGNIMFSTNDGRSHMIELWE
ncbi:MAG: lamin tail domain-containing protein [Elusimicrobiota bacterium]